jgi:hypothetical protein
MTAIKQSLGVGNWLLEIGLQIQAFLGQSQKPRTEVPSPHKQHVK